MRYFLKTIFKYPYQRVKYGYDERIKWEFDSYFAQFIKPLEEFCQEELANKEIMELNPRRKRIFTKTLQLIEDYKNMSYEDEWKNNNQSNKLWRYVGKNIQSYWN